LFSFSFSSLHVIFPPLTCKRLLRIQDVHSRAEVWSQDIVVVEIKLVLLLVSPCSASQSVFVLVTDVRSRDVSGCFIDLEDGETRRTICY
jgi:hypothetical protein